MPHLHTYKRLLESRPTFKVSEELVQEEELWDKLLHIRVGLCAGETP